MNAVLTARAVVAAALLAATPLASAEPVLKGGERELEFFASIVEDTTEFGGVEMDTSLVTATVRGGWFLSPENEVGLLATLVRADAGFGSSTFGQVGGFYDRNFPVADSRIVPVVGVSAQAALGDATGSIFEASAGVRVFASDEISVNWRAFYAIADTEDDAGNEFESTRFGLRVGFSWIIR